MTNTGVIYCGTGHRPDKLGGYTAEAEEKLIRYATMILPDYAPMILYLGMAQGWDQALAHACTRLGIPFIAAVPFKGQESRWPKPAQEIYNKLLALAQEVIVVCDGGYHPSKMQTRNELMVDRSKAVLALWDGSKGGTYNCLQYAKSLERHVFNVWPGWASDFGTQVDFWKGKEL